MMSSAKDREACHRWAAGGEGGSSVFGTRATLTMQPLQWATTKRTVPAFLQQASLWVAVRPTPSLSTREAPDPGPGGAGAEQPTHHAARSYSAQTRTNSSRW